jgi:UDP-2-acetamido-3-amino-2,3-dideoxy-glucuronate N-acetyltransferase
MAGYVAHESSYIDDGCQIGDDTTIWHFCHVMTGAVIGRACNLGQGVVISPGVVIGDNVKIQNYVLVYTGVTLEDDVFCGPSMVFTNVVNPRSHVSRRHEFKRTRVRRGASLGANSTIVCGHTIGRYAFIGAGAVVTKDVPDYALVLGNPARIAGWMCECGIKLATGATPPAETRCAVCHARYQRQADGALARLDETAAPNPVTLTGVP